MSTEVDDATDRQALHGLAHGIAANTKPCGEIRFNQTLTWHHSMLLQVLHDRAIYAPWRPIGFSADPKFKFAGGALLVGQVGRLNLR